MKSHQLLAAILTDEMLFLLEKKYKISMLILAVFNYNEG